MVVDLPRRWGWTIAAMSVAALALLVAFVIVVRSAPLDEAPPRDMPVVWRPVPAAVVEPLAGPRAEAVASAAASPVANAAAPGEGDIELCGGAWVKANADGSFDRTDFDRTARAPEVRARIVAALRADPSELAQAAAAWFATVVIGDGASQDAPGAAAARDALARQALAATDPRVYALAFNACGGNKHADGACQLLNAAQWARLDPTNATPWLHVLAAARERNDRAGQDEALHRIATAQRSEVGFFAVPGLIANAAPAGDAPALLASWTMALESVVMQPRPSYQPLLTACRSETLRDANRRQTCSAIATLLTDSADTLIERGIGATLGQQLGWPAERNDSLRGSYRAYAEHRAAMLTPGPGGSHFGCAGLRRGLEMFRQSAARGGEMGGLREWLAQSGKTPEGFARDERAWREADAERGNAVDEPASVAAVPTTATTTARR
jgi:hypothetical protein